MPPHEIVFSLRDGIGNAAVAAQRCGVAKFIGIELDAEYFDVAKERFWSVASIGGQR